MADETPELAFYYPAFMWHDARWVKNIVLFFDGVALLVPEYMKRRPFDVDPAIATGLEEHGLLTILEPESFIDQASAELLASQLTDIIASGALDALDRQTSSFGELSYSRLGYEVDPGLAGMIVEELQKRGLAGATEDGVSVPVHRKVHSLVLVLLAQILRTPGRARGLVLHPATDRPNIHEALKDLLGSPPMPTAGRVVSLDLQTVGVDLGPVPLEEVLAFRNEHGTPYRRYAADLRAFVSDLSRMPPEDRQSQLRLRQEQIHDAANDLAKTAQQAWKQPLTFILGIAGAAWAVKTGDVITGILGAGTALAGAGMSGQGEASAYSYLFDARARFNPPRIPSSGPAG
jgi:hypothetical protein